MLATRVLLGEGPAQARQARRAFGEPAESGRKGARIERCNGRLVWFNAGPVRVSDRLVHGPMIPATGRESRAPSQLVVMGKSRVGEAARLI